MMTHKFVKAGKKDEGAYPHLILAYEDTGTKDTWFAHLDDVDQTPYKVVRGTPPAKVGFEIEYPLRSHQEDKIQHLIQFEQRFAELKKHDLRKVLSKNFVFSNEVGELMNCIFRGKQNGILYGPGGHGKSEMVVAILEEFGLLPYTFVKSFGEGLSESALYGGNDMKVLRDEGEIIYKLDKAFTTKQIVIFEEMFDAPPMVLLSLKHTLTSGFVANGAQTQPISSAVILGLTNKAPKDVAKDDARQALIERFPLHMEVKWSRYKAEDYRTLLEAKGFSKKLYESVGATNADFYLSVYCQLVENAGKLSGRPISPRIACSGFNAIITSIENNEVDDRYYHFVPLKFVQGFEKIQPTIEDTINEIGIYADSFKALSELEAKTKAFTLEYNGMLNANHSDPKEALKKMTSMFERIQQMQEEYSGYQLHDDHIGTFQSYLEILSSRANELKQEIVRVSLKETGMDTSTFFEDFHFDERSGKYTTS